MGLLNISDSEIRILAADNQVYEQGVSYYSDAKVSGLSYDEENRRLEARVESTPSYPVRIEFKHPGALQCRCGCAVSYTGAGVCQHVVAVLKAAQAEFSSSRPGRPGTPAAVKEFLSFFENLRPGNSKEEINFAVELSLSLIPGVSAHVSFKVGRERLYVVKDIPAFLRAVAEERPMFFGKEFTFEPLQQAFKKDDRPVVDLLGQIYALHQEWTGEYTYLSTVIGKRYMVLKGVSLKRMLDTLGDKVFTLSVDRKLGHEVRLRKETLPLKFSLQTRDQDMYGVVFGCRGGAAAIDEGWEVISFTGRRFSGLPTRASKRFYRPVAESLGL
ncbi:hypothetical protein CEB3_c22750 [Peptococcaceae bacterium CEB3]|nr:hypothetical protein CEB3_c22750 [Peptococcaceae bacterium CEB3]